MKCKKNASFNTKLAKISCKCKKNEEIKNIFAKYRNTSCFFEKDVIQYVKMRKMFLLWECFDGIHTT